MKEVKMSKYDAMRITCLSRKAAKSNKALYDVTKARADRRECLNPLVLLTIKVWRGLLLELLLELGILVLLVSLAAVILNILVSDFEKVLRSLEYKKRFQGYKR